MLKKDNFFIHNVMISERSFFPFPLKSGFFFRWRPSRSTPKFEFKNSVYIVRKSNKSIHSKKQLQSHK